MTQKKNLHQNNESFERQVFEALKFYGYKLPKTDEEIEMYVKMFGNTKIELPDSMADAGEIFDNFSCVENSNQDCDGVWAMAAQGDKEDLLPEHVLKKIKMDIKKGKWLYKNENDDKQRRN